MNLIIEVPEEEAEKLKTYGAYVPEIVLRGIRHELAEREKATQSSAESTEFRCGA